MAKKTPLEQASISIDERIRQDLSPEEVEQVLEKRAEEARRRMHGTIGSAGPIQEKHTGEQQSVRKK